MQNKNLKINISEKRNKETVNISDSRKKVSIFFLSNLIKFGYYTPSSRLENKLDSNKRIDMEDIDKGFRSVVSYLINEPFNVIHSIKEDESIWIEPSLFEDFLEFTKMDEMSEVTFELTTDDSISKYEAEKISNKAMSSVIGMLCKFHYRQMSNEECVLFGKFQHKFDSIEESEDIGIEVLILLSNTIDAIIKRNEKALHYQNFLNNAKKAIEIYMKHKTL